MAQKWRTKANETNPPMVLSHSSVPRVHQCN